MTANIIHCQPHFVAFSLYQVNSMKQKLWRILAIIVGLLAAALLITAIWARPIADHPFYDQFSRWPLVIAHQGGYGLWPSNTMYAYERAVDMGVDMLEMDLHITADGALVLMHDGTVDRTTNGSGEIEDMLMHVADTYDDDVRLTIDAVVGLLEPAIIVVMGLFVGFLVLAILLPILKMK